MGRQTEIINAPRKHGNALPDFTEDEVETIEKLAGYGLTTTDIASYFGMSRRALQYRMANAEPGSKLSCALKNGRARAKAKVTQTAFRMATSGKIPAMTIFWLKTQARWKEPKYIQHGGTVGLEGIIAKSREKNLSPAEEAKVVEQHLLGTIIKDAEKEDEPEKN